jgi:AcrR family transcriptional regulator
MKRTAERSVTEVRLVEAAAQLFSRQGFKGTSTRDIAQLAGVNEATLFRYFGKKTDLFWAAAESRLNRLKFGRELQSGLASDREPDVIVPMLAAFMVDNMSEHPELMRLLYVARFELPGADQVFREHLGPIFDAVHAYFSRCAAKGLIRDLDPTIATLGLAGAVSAHLNLHQLFTGRDEPWDARSAAPIYAQLWLNALQQKPRHD